MHLVFSGLQSYLNVVKCQWANIHGIIYEASELYLQDVQKTQVSIKIGMLHLFQSYHKINICLPIVFLVLQYCEPPWASHWQEERRDK